MAKVYAIDLLAELTKYNDLKGTKVSKTEIPAAVRRGLDSWISDVNIEFDNIEQDVWKASYFDDEREFYVFSFYSDAAEVYTGIVIIQEDAVVGESSNISS